MAELTKKFKNGLPSEDNGERLQSNGVEAVQVPMPEPPVDLTAGETQGYWRKVRGNKALMVDVISRVLFPVAFVVFNISYWATYWDMDV